MESADRSPKVSVVVPTYNRAQYMRTAVQSVLDQTCDDFEVVLIDDGSSDDTPEVGQRLSKSDVRVRYIRNEQNLGLVENWKKGVQETRGDYFCILGDDDVLEPEFLDRLVEPLEERPDVALSFCDHWLIDEDGRTLAKATERNTNQWRRNQLQEGLIDSYAQTLLVNRSAFIGAVMFDRDRFDLSFFDLRATAFIDLWMLYKLWGSGNAFYISDRLVSCRRHEGCVSQNFDWRLYGARGEIFCLRTFLNEPRLDDADTIQIFEERLSSALTTFGNTLLSAGERLSARRHLKEAYGLNPTLRAAVGRALSYLGPIGTELSKVARWMRNRFGPDPSVYPEEHAGGMLTSEDSKEISSPSRLSENQNIGKYHEHDDVSKVQCP